MQGVRPIVRLAGMPGRCAGGWGAGHRWALAPIAGAACRVSGLPRWSSARSTIGYRLHHRGRQAPTKAVCASRLVTAHWLALCAGLDAADRPLPAFVGQEFDAFLTCGILAHGALRVRCDACQLKRLVATLTKRIARHLVRRGWLAEDAEGAALTGEDLGDSGLGQLRAHSITYRIAVGP
jgi:hypothetical protein